jgi:hypothetical protein
MMRTVAEGQVGTVRDRRERTGGKPSTVGTRTGSEAGSRGRAGDHERSPRVIDGDGRARQREGTGSALTQGDPGAEKPGEVSRGHSSEEVRRKPGGAKGRRTKEPSPERTWMNGTVNSETAGATTAVTTRSGDRGPGGEAASSRGSGVPPGRLRDVRQRAVAFNRRMRQTARPVVWEGAEAQSPAPDPITSHLERESTGCDAGQSVASSAARRIWSNHHRARVVRRRPRPARRRASGLCNFISICLRSIAQPFCAQGNLPHGTSAVQCRYIFQDLYTPVAPHPRPSRVNRKP